MSQAGFFLVQVYLDFSLSHQVAQKLAHADAKRTFKRVKFHIIPLHYAKCFFQVLNMFYASFTFDN